MEKNDKISTKQKSSHNIKKISKPMIAGFLLIIAGIISLSLWISIISIDISTIEDLKENDANFRELTEGASAEDIRDYYMICGTIGVIIAIFSILGGVLAIKKKMWGIALASGVLGVFTIIQMIIPGFLSIIAVVLLIISRNEFQTKKQIEIDKINH